MPTSCCRASASAPYGTPHADTTTYSYDQARTGYYNVGHRTTASNWPGHPGAAGSTVLGDEIQ